MHNQFSDVRFYLVEQGRTGLHYIISHEARLRRNQKKRSCS
nr:hypothetical protein [uncultured Acetatifactor sp.]